MGLIRHEISSSNPRFLHGTNPDLPSIPTKDFVDVHNVVRAEVGVGAITWNETLAAYALSYANQRIADCNMEHSGGPYGEHLAEGSWEMAGEEAVKLWAAEKPYYDYGSNSCVGDECGETRFT
ncbi:hypothetical protein L484_000500 [Morus notabilis]|uniref:SCP domain-containing protein n=1 Tax=Morus notabilis TaxID=981085 RepID=W9SP33_9ROSA|nr:basic form of pathogenesis-related protein 1 [Morus notabilis]EXC41379.1 hypothetical protein L484_000500 [Morus notabilis]